MDQSILAHSENQAQKIATRVQLISNVIKECERSSIGGIKKNLGNTIVLLEIIRQYIVSGNTGLALNSMAQLKPYCLLWPLKRYGYDMTCQSVDIDDKIVLITR